MQKGAFFMIGSKNTRLTLERFLIGILEPTLSDQIFLVGSSAGAVAP